DLFDRLVWGFLTRIQQDGVGRRHERRYRATGVELVPPSDLVLQRRQRNIDPALGHLAMPPPRALVDRCGKENLDGRIRRDDGSDVAALRDDIAFCEDLSLMANELAPDTFVRTDGRYRPTHLGRPGFPADRPRVDDQPVGSEVDRRPLRKGSEGRAIRRLDPL